MNPAARDDVSAAVGVVVIGRNEGARLVRCIESLAAHAAPLVYVDSNSTDDSVAQARRLGAHVQVLDPALPFTAARARNVGWRALLALHPQLAGVQFVDGDCEVHADWIATAAAHLRSHTGVAAVAGRRRERFPDATVYNRLCDIEWDTPIGPTLACGGDALMRTEALQAVGGFCDDLIAGEEPELCVRLRAAGWHIHRIDAEMTLHDAAMSRFGQWWKRTMRGGYAFAEGAHLHGKAHNHWVREARSAAIWGLLLPLAIAAGAVLWSPWAWLLLTIYPLQVARLALSAPATSPIRWPRAFFLVLGKFAEGAGWLKFHALRLSGARGRLIEYK
jgi:glycosyltransferase involved in cell wall biosynthesis